MKNLILVFAFIFITTAAFAQKRNDLQGPEFKNYKPWMHKIEAIVIYTNTTKNKLIGSEFKNYKIWENKKEDTELVTIVKSKRSKLTGPKYKNFKH
ncbi:MULTISPECIES: hypothetical protein [unclassified Polaribacter]|uniref:hypothetical protein n=1 Tax=unclassified Polaribacter TaxID=196858 RepID=UPI0011BD865C|nr:MULTISPECIES: hypothetical protein [unclassified Polaribacter]TXD53961.1 hypothetical protein ES043_02745 [Polaribacter sp. IC063]TXD59670.1 hypothetical protein ES044_09460 [Polaribacter sp. IC066]